MPATRSPDARPSQSPAARARRRRPRRSPRSPPANPPRTRGIKGWDDRRQAELRRRSFGRRATPAAAPAADIVNELGPDFIVVPPSQATSHCAPRRQYDGELGGNVVILGDELHATLGHFRDRAVARQRAVILNLREAL